MNASPLRFPKCLTQFWQSHAWWPITSETLLRTLWSVVSLIYLYPWVNLDLRFDEESWDDFHVGESDHTFVAMCAWRILFIIIIAREQEIRFPSKEPPLLGEVRPLLLPLKRIDAHNFVCCIGKYFHVCSETNAAPLSSSARTLRWMTGSSSWLALRGCISPGCGSRNIRERRSRYL